MASFPPANLLLQWWRTVGSDGRGGGGGEKFGVLLLDPITIKGEGRKKKKKERVGKYSHCFILLPTKTYLSTRSKISSTQIMKINFYKIGNSHTVDVRSSLWEETGAANACDPKEGGEG